MNSCGVYSERPGPSSPVPVSPIHCRTQAADVPRACLRGPVARLCHPSPVSHPPNVSAGTRAACRGRMVIACPMPGAAAPQAPSCAPVGGRILAQRSAWKPSRCRLRLPGPAGAGHPRQPDDGGGTSERPAPDEACERVEAVVGGREFPRGGTPAAPGSRPARRGGAGRVASPRGRPTRSTGRRTGRSGTRAPVSSPGSLPVGERVAGVAGQGLQAPPPRCRGQRSTAASRPARRRRRRSWRAVRGRPRGRPRRNRHHRRRPPHQDERHQGLREGVDGGGVGADHRGRHHQHQQDAPHRGLGTGTAWRRGPGSAAATRRARTAAQPKSGMSGVKMHSCVTMNVPWSVQTMPLWASASLPAAGSTVPAVLGRSGRR